MPSLFISHIVMPLPPLSSSPPFRLILIQQEGCSRSDHIFPILVSRLTPSTPSHPFPAELFFVESPLRTLTAVDQSKFFLSLFFCSMPFFSGTLFTLCFRSTHHVHTLITYPASQSLAAREHAKTTEN